MQAAIRLNNMPLDVVLVLRGSEQIVAIRRIADFPGIIENGEGVLGNFYQDGFLISENGEEEDLHYQTGYSLRDLPLLKRWIQKQEIPLPPEFIRSE